VFKFWRCVSPKFDENDNIGVVFKGQMNQNSERNDEAESEGLDRDCYSNDTQPTSNKFISNDTVRGIMLVF